MLRAAGLTLTTVREYSNTTANSAGNELAITNGSNRQRNAAGSPSMKTPRFDVTWPSDKAVIDHGARMFCVPRADITAADLAARFITNISAIAVAAHADGLFIYSVQPHRIVRPL